MNEIRFIIPGDPKPLRRARHGRDGRVYDTHENKLSKQKIATLAKIAMGDQSPLAGPLVAAMTFAHDARSRKARNGVDRFKTTRADLDNLVKLVCDALNGIAYQDDAQVVRLYAEKVWADEAYTEVMIAPVTVT